MDVQASHFEATRRDFLKMATSGLVGGSIVAAASPAISGAEEAPGKTWDYETDVVVVGYGGAGAIAAICAGEAGADVIIIEAAPIEGGGTTRMSGAYFLWPEDPEAAAEYLKASNHGAMSDELIEAWAIGISRTRDWLTNHGIPWAPSNTGHLLMNPPGGQKNKPFSGTDFPNLPGAEAIDTNQVAGRGIMLYQFTDSIIRGMDNVQILFDTRGIDLIQDSETRLIKGIKALQDSGATEISIKARRGVILASGGFGHNPDMIRRFMRPDYGILSCEAPYNVGDGHKMAMKAGAALANMTFGCGTWPSFVTPVSPIAWANRLDTTLKAKSWLFTNALGNRWMCETPFDHPHRQWLHYGDIDWTQSADNTGYTDIPNWLIFDETVRAAGPIVSGSDGLQVIPTEIGGAPDGWSADNSREIEQGVILQADTLEELADAINAYDEDGARVIRENLIATVERYNEFAESGVDEDFGRAADQMTPIVTPPFYAVKLNPTLYSTAGGPEKNGNAQVLDPFGEPIPHLFACGTVAHTHAHLYTTFGANIGENFAFGRIAGQAAAATEVWE